MTDILLVQSPNPILYSPKSIEIAENSSPPLGISYLASYLRLHGFSVAIADLHIELKRPKDIRSFMDWHSPSVIGISSNTVTYPCLRQTVLEIRKLSPSIPIILGGMHPSALPEEVLSENEADFVVRGEGEFTLLELVESLLKSGQDIEHIKGISYRHNGTIFHNPDRPCIEDINTIPFPARDLLPLDAYIQKGSMISSRGCPIRCMFCACGAFSGFSYRIRSAGNIIDEIEGMIQYFDIQDFTFQDDTFTLYPSRVKAICTEIIKKGWEIQWGCQSRVSSITAELTDIMVASGCKAIQFGVESGNQDILNQSKKRIRIDQVIETVKIARQSGIEDISCSFIVGHPGDTERTIRETIDFAKSLKELGATHTPFTIMTPLPGTDIFLEPEKYGLTITDKNWEEYTFSRAHLQTRHFSKEEIEDLYFDALWETIPSVNLFFHSV